MIKWLDTLSKSSLRSEAGDPPGFGVIPPTETVLSDRRRWAVVGLLFALALINYLDRATIALALPAISRELKLPPITKGTLLSSFFWSYALMQVPIGFAIDRLNLRWFFAFMFTLWSLACGFTSLAGSLLFLTVARNLLGIGESVYLPGATTIVSRLFGRSERRLPSGLFNSGTRAGLVVGGPLISWMVVRYGWRQIFLLIGGGSLIWLVPWFVLFPDSLNPDPIEKGINRVPANQTYRPLLTFNRNLLGICIGFFCLDYYAYLLLTWLPDYLVEVRHFTLLVGGSLTAIPYLVFGVGEPAGGWIADRFIRAGHDETLIRKTVVAVAFLAGLMLVPAMMVKDSRLALALIAASSLIGLSTTNVTVILQGCAPPRQVGAWAGVENFVGNLGGVIAPVSMGALIARTGY